MKINYGIRRLNLGGKALTNYLKEIISFRTWNMMEETFLMNVVKEKLCYVSTDFVNDLHETRKPENRIKRGYVLPDYTSTHRGHIIQDPNYFINPTPKPADDSNTEQVLVMNNERISVPEILFNPSDIGLEQAGIPEMIEASIKATVADMHPSLYNNILLVGGNSLFPGYRQRVEQEVRQLAPDNMKVNVTLHETPITAAWKGGSLFAQNSETYHKIKLSKLLYEENGPSLFHQHFSIF